MSGLRYTDKEQEVANYSSISVTYMDRTRTDLQWAGRKRHIPLDTLPYRTNMRAGNRDHNMDLQYVGCIRSCEG